MRCLKDYTLLLRAKLAAWGSVRLVGTGPKAAPQFFGALLPDALGYRSVQHLLGKVKPLRVLEIGERLSFEETVERRVSRACTFVMTLVDDSYTFGYKGLSDGEVTEQLCRWLIMDWCGVAIKQVKTHLTWLSGHGRGVKAPTDGLLDMPGLLLTTKYREWTKQQLRSISASREERKKVMAETFLLGTKRGFPSEEDDMVEQAGVKYSLQMKTDLPRNREDTLTYDGRVYDLDRECAEAIQSTVFEVVGRTDTVPHSPYCPSQRAGYKAPILKGGILGALLRDGLTTIAEVLVAIIEHRGSIYEVRGYEVDSASVYKHMLDKWGNVNNDEIADCQVYFIREPLKLRTITAGTPDLYGAQAPMLKHLRDGMKRFKVFQLTRATCTTGVIEERLNQNPLGRDAVRLGSVLWDWFISGDYQQSTNDLAMWATSTAVAAAFQGQAWRVADKALGAQWIHVTKENSFAQQRGQLMGSPLSFPFLCMINAGLARLAYEIVHPELRERRENPVSPLGLDAYPFLVNGDDFLARASPEIYEVWQRVIAHVGWKLSPGKSYFLERLAQINSETREVVRVVENDGRPSEGKPVTYKLTEPIPFVNGGHLQQLKKATSQIDRATYETMSLDWEDRYRKMERLPRGMCRRAREVMEKNLLPLLDELYRERITPFRLNLTNPRDLGGIGLPTVRWTEKGLRYEEQKLEEECAWRALHASKPRKESVRYTYERTGEAGLHERSREPLLEWTDRAPARLDTALLLDKLVDSIDDYVQRLLQPRAQTRPGIIDITCNAIYSACVMPHRKEINFDSSVDPIPMGDLMD